MRRPGDLVAPRSRNKATHLTHWPHASVRQVRLRPPCADRDGLASGRSSRQRGDSGRRQDIPHGFLQAILADLRRAGIVMSQRGQSGGWRMGRPATDVSVADVIRAVDGPLVSVYGLRPEAVPGYTRRLTSSSTCGSPPAETLRDVFESVSIQELADGRLPTRSTSRTADEDAWQPHDPGGQPPAGRVHARPRAC